MTALEWPTERPWPGRHELPADPDSTLDQVMNEEMSAADAQDDPFARLVTALLTLLDAHRSDRTGRCGTCRTDAPCEVVETVHHSLRQPLTLLWWHIHKQPGRPMPIDAIDARIDPSAKPHCWD